MNQKTEPLMPVSNEEKKPEFASGFVRWMVTLTVMTLAYVFLSNFLFVRFGPSFFTPLPWATAGGLVIQQGLTLFSGGQPEIPSLGVQLGILGGLLLAVVIAPLAFFFSWRKLLIEHQKKGVVRPANIGFILGGVVVLFYVLTIALGAIIQHKAFNSMRTAHALGENRDGIIGELSLVSLDAYQYRILPRSLRGGGGSYSGYDIPDRLNKTTEATYQIVNVSDSTITLAGTSVKYDGALIQGVYGGDGTLKGPFAFRGEFQ